MDKQFFLRRLRMFLSDPDGKIWDDTELNRLLEDSLKKYCQDSGCFTGSFDFFPDENGVYHYPDDFAGYMIGWNNVSHEILPITGRELFVRSGCDVYMRGDPDYIMDDFCNSGEFYLHPVPCDMQDRMVINITTDFGEVLDNDYGVFLSDDYGTTLSISEFTYSGTLFYRRVGRFEDIKDYMAVICYALHLAYDSDSEFGNSELSSYWEDIYRSRVAVFGRVQHNNIGCSRVVNFY